MTIEIFPYLDEVPRPLRIEYAGATYHVLSRGERREAIFLSDADREVFLETLGQACRRSGWQVHAWCLMTNHFHLVVETPRANLAGGMKWSLGTYTQRFNRKHHLSGHLFQGRYKAQVIDGENRGYLRAPCDYVHLNPERAKLIKSGAALTRWRWSSYGQYLGVPVSYFTFRAVVGKYLFPKIEDDSPPAR